MNAKELMNPARFFMEIGQDALKAFNGSAGLELPLERLANGRLTEACKNNLTFELQKFIDRKNWQPRARVFCAIGARGVALRRLRLPGGLLGGAAPPAPTSDRKRIPRAPGSTRLGLATATGNADRT